MEVICVVFKDKRGNMCILFSLYELAHCACGRNNSINSKISNRFFPLRIFKKYYISNIT